MVPLRVFCLIVIGPDQPSVLVLEPIEENLPGKKRIISIWIGAHEAVQLNLAIEHTQLSRPTTHELVTDMLTNLDARVDHVVISDVKGQRFYATLVLNQYGRLIHLDARPTDAITLALRQNAPLYIEEDILERASYPFLFNEKLTNEEELQEFRSFLEKIVPEDFD